MTRRELKNSILLVELILKSGPAKFIYEEHKKLASNDEVQDHIIAVPGSEVKGK